MGKLYKVVVGVICTNDGIGHQPGTLIDGDGLSADALAYLVDDGSLVELTATDTGKTPPKEPHPEQIAQPLTKVIEPTVKKGKGK